MKKYLIIYYSRTENTHQIARELSKKINCDVERISDIKDWNGIIGFIKGGHHALKKKTTEIFPIKNKVENYETIIFASPIWASNIPPAIRTYYNKNKDKINKVAFLLNNNGSDIKKAINNFSNLLGEPIATVNFNKKERKDFTVVNSKINKFIEDLES